MTALVPDLAGLLSVPLLGEALSALDFALVCAAVALGASAQSSE